MKSNRCLYCYKELSETEVDFHSRCSRLFFGTSRPPELPYTENQLKELAQKIINSHVGLTGVQPKLSLDLTGDNNSGKERLTIVGTLGGGYILKPHMEKFPTLPVVEDLTMHLAKLAGIMTVPHSLIRMKSGNLAYITRRIDRQDGQKIHMEDMCQLSERLTEDKYKGSYEQVARVISRFSDAPGLDVVNFFEQVLFCFITGNADMHLKNFSLISSSGRGYGLSPAYDMVSTALVMPEDDEDLALTLNAKKKKIRKKDFEMAFKTAQLNANQIENLFKRIKRFVSQANDFIDISFLSEEDKNIYKEIIQERAQRLER
ncbi:HipA domain-containing protein [Chitinophaga sp.]|uniref:HipA domain-containing protein n=1 Tax=Chitinophaga sp. TaxID=1869181 RepID=UPI0031D8AF36